MGQLTVMRAKAKGKDGLAVEVDVGEHLVRVDMPVPRGGANTAPAPGHLMRAAVASCLVIGYKTSGAEVGVPIDEVEIDFATENDMQAQTAIGKGPVGWQKMRWHVRVTTTADEARVAEALDRAEALSPMLASIDPSCERIRTFEIRRPA
jgi:uncharacterized OsmC-like protein